MLITLQKKLLTIVMVLLLHSAECYINGKRENFLMISETEQHQSYSSNNSFDMDHMWRMRCELEKLLLSFSLIVFWVNIMFFMRYLTKSLKDKYKLIFRKRGNSCVQILLQNIHIYRYSKSNVSIGMGSGDIIPIFA